MTIVEWNTKLNHRTSALFGRSRSPKMPCIRSETSESGPSLEPLERTVPLPPIEIPIIGRAERAHLVVSSARIFYLYMPGRRKSSRQRGSSFSGTITRSRAGKATILLLFRQRQTDRTPGRRKSSRQRGLSFQRRLRDGEGERTHYLSVATFLWSGFTIIYSYECASCLTQHYDNTIITPVTC